MSVVLRLARSGAKKRPFYHVVATDSRNPRDGRYLESVGHFNPKAKGGEVELRLKEERIDYWIAQGAQPSDRVRSLIKQFKRASTPEAQKALREKKYEAAAAKRAKIKAAAAKAAAQGEEATEETEAAPAEKAEPKANANTEKPKADAKASKEEPKKAADAADADDTAASKTEDTAGDGDKTA